MRTDFFLSDKKWTSIFGENYTPKNLTVNCAIFKDSSIILELHSPIDNEKSPAKWIEKGCNEFGFDLVLANVKLTDINEFNFYGSIRIETEKNISGYDVHLEISESCIINCTAECISIYNIKAYHSDDFECKYCRYEK